MYNHRFHRHIKKPKNGLVVYDGSFGYIGITVTLCVGSGVVFGDSVVIGAGVVVSMVIAVAVVLHGQHDGGAVVSLSIAYGFAHGASCSSELMLILMLIFRLASTET